jgi:hypothetical protein
MLGRPHRKLRFLDYTDGNKNTYAINSIQEVKEITCLELLADLDDIGVGVTPLELKKIKNLLTVLLHELFLRQQKWFPNYLKLVETLLHEKINEFTAAHARVMREFDLAASPAEKQNFVAQKIEPLYTALDDNLKSIFTLLKSGFVSEDLLLPDEDFYKIIEAVKLEVIKTLDDENLQTKEALEAAIADLAHSNNILLNLGNDLLSRFIQPTIPKPPRFITSQDLLNLIAQQREWAGNPELYATIAPVMEAYVNDCIIISSLLEDTEENIKLYLPEFTPRMLKLCYEHARETISQQSPKYLFLEILAQQRTAKPFLETDITNQLVDFYHLNQIDRMTRKKILFPAYPLENLYEKVINANYAVHLEVCANQPQEKVYWTPHDIKMTLGRINYENIFAGLSDLDDLSRHQRDREVAIKAFDRELKKADSVEQISMLVQIAKPYINRHQNPYWDYFCLGKDTATWTQKLQAARAKALDILSVEAVHKPPVEGVALLKSWENRAIFSQHRNHFWFSDLPWRTQSQTKIKKLRAQIEDKPLINLSFK